MSWLDSLYFNEKITKKLSDLEGAKNFASKFSDGKLSLEGYVFLIEISINSFIHSTEFLFEKENLFELTHWGDTEDKREELRKLLESTSKEILFISELEKIRKKLTALRFSGYIEENRLKKILEELNTKVDEVMDFYFSNLKYIEDSSGKSNEKSKLVGFIFSVLNYVESDFGLGKEPTNKITPLFIPGSHYTIMPNNLYKNYHLQNKKIDEKIYVKGYSLGLGWIYCLSNLDEKLINNLVNSNSWEDMHHKGARIVDSKRGKDNSPLNSIFELKDKPYEVKKGNKEINNIGELRYVLRDRRIRTLEELHSGDYPVRRLLLQTFTDGILFNSDKKNKAEIIEFQIKRNGGEETRYSYAIFFGVGNGLWDASQWILFDDISVENSWEPHCYFREHYLNIIKALDESVEFSEYIVDENLLLEYRKRKDHKYMISLDNYKQIENSNSLLVELIGLFYFMKEEDNIIDFGWHIDPTEKYETDLDAFVVSDDQLTIIQSKQSFNVKDPTFDFNPDEDSEEDFDPEEKLDLENDISCKEILSHFDKAIKIVPEKYKNKKVQKKLFVFEDTLDDWLKKNVRNYLKDNAIELIYFDEIENKKEIFSKDLIDKINLAFDRIIFEKREGEEDEN